MDVKSLSLEKQEINFYLDGECRDSIMTRSKFLQREIKLLLKINMQDIPENMQRRCNVQHVF